VTALLRAVLLVDLEELAAMADAEAETAAARLSGEALWAAMAVAAATGTSTVVDVAAIETRAEQHGLEHGEWGCCEDMCRILLLILTPTLLFQVMSSKSSCSRRSWTSRQTRCRRC